MKLKYMDPEMIMTVVIALIILAVGVFAFFVTINSIPTAGMSTQMTMAIANVSNTGDTVFNIVGIVLVIGAIMTIVGLVYSHVRPGGY